MNTLRSQISNVESQISNLKSQISNFKSQSPSQNRSWYRPLSVAMFVLPILPILGCETGPGGLIPGGNSQPVSATWNDKDGLTLTDGKITLVVPADVIPSNPNITLKPLNADELLPANVPAGSGFDVGGEFGPSGTTFSAPVRVTVTLSEAAPASSLPVLLLDEATGNWGWAGVNATVESDGLTASFEVTHFSGYRVWNPRPPAGDVPIGDNEIISGTGFFEGQPFNTLPSPQAADASLIFSPFGNAFGLSIVQTDITNPATGDFITILAGLHATSVGTLEKARVAIVTPAGGFSGQSAFVDGLSPAKGISGIMYLRKSATHWMVDVYCAYEGGIVFGQASGPI